MNRYAHIVIISILLSLWFFNYTVAQQIIPRFEHLTNKDGLPENSVFGIEQDYLGYMWFGTQNGLVRYDGYSMKVYLPELKGNTDEEGVRYVYCIYEDKSKDLWLGTNGGLIKYVRENDSFINYTTIHSDSNSINSNWITCIYEDNSGNLWIGTDKGLNLFNRKNESFRHYFFNQSHFNSDSSQTSTNQNSEVIINSIIEYPSPGYLLLGINKEGLYSFDIEKEVFKKYELKFTQKPKKKIGNIHSFCLAKNNTLWIGCSSGVIKLNRNNNICRLYSDFYSEVNPKRESFTQVIESNSGLLYVFQTFQTISKLN